MAKEEKPQVDVAAEEKAKEAVEAKAKAEAEAKEAAEAKAKEEAEAKAKAEAAVETLDDESEAKRIFKMHPQAPELHFASDGTAFFEPFPAKNYANKLKDKEVTVIKRKSLKF